MQNLGTAALDWREPVFADEAKLSCAPFSCVQALSAARKALDLDHGFTLSREATRRRNDAAKNPTGGGQTRVDSDQSGASAAGTAGGSPETGATPALLAAWLQAVAERGDRDAFARLHRHFAPRLTGFLTRAGLAPAQVEDVIQETMFAVWRKATLYRPEQGGVATWIFVIARNQRVDMMRRKANREMAPLEDWDPADDAANGEELILAGEREARLRAALARLSADQREVLRQAYFSEKPQSAIAAELGLPLGTVKSRLRLALSRLRQLIEDKP